jgi:gliding motility-associated-like protein
LRGIDHQPRHFNAIPIPLVYFGECLTSPGAARPFQLECIADEFFGVEVAFDSPGIYDFAAFLAYGAQRVELAFGPKARLFLELADSRVQRGFRCGEFAFGDGPAASALVSPVGAAGVDEEYLRVRGEAVEEDAGGLSSYHWVNGYKELAKNYYFVVGMLRLLTITLVLSCCQPALGQLAARFSADKTGGCGPLVVHFTDQSVGIGATPSYQWDLGNGNMAAIADPVATYTQPGSYTVTLTVKAGNQTSTSSQTITVYTAPTAAFTVSATKVCTPTAIGFTSNSTQGSGAIASYLWDFGDGVTSSVPTASVTHSYGAAGVEGVSLTVTDANGCTSTQVQPGLLTILPRMNIGFTESKQFLCNVGDPEQFTNTSTGPGTLTYNWSFGDGGTSTQLSPVYSYPAKGTYTVTLTATSSLGCVVSDSQINVINVANFQAGFSLPANVCLNALAPYTDQSAPTPTGQQWRVDGNYAYVYPYPQPGLIFSAAGTHTVTQVDYFGTCQRTATHSVTVNALPAIPPFDVVLADSCGAPTLVKVLDHTPGATTWNWLFNYDYGYGNQAPAVGGPANSYNYTGDGTFWIQLTVTNAAGCSSTVQQPVTIEPPAINIIETSGAPQASCDSPLTKTFACPQLSQLLSWKWLFGDGTNSTQATPTHVFSAPGTYQTTLAWATKNGCVGTSNAITTIIAGPVSLSFTANDTVVCPGQSVIFLVGGQSNTEYGNLDFGDGYSSGGNGNGYSFGGNVQHFYNQPGEYSVTETITNLAGCTYTLTKKNYIRVLTAPVIGMSATTTCSGDRGDVTFHVQVTGSDSLFWDFGDGTRLKTDSSVTQLVHNYSASGSYPVNVSASNGVCTAVAITTANVLRRPANFQLSAVGYPVNGTVFVCPNTNLPVAIQVTTGNPRSTYYPLQWTEFQYGDSSYYGYYNYSQSSNPNYGSYGYTLNGFQAGETKLRAIATDGNGCPDTSNWINLVVGGEKAGFEIVSDDHCYQQPVVLMDTSTSPARDPIVSTSWSFGDGASSTQSGTVTHLYANPGEYNVQLTVKDSLGCYTTTNYYAEPVSVNGPQAAFNVPQGTVLPQGTTVQFYNNSNTYGTTNVLWQWSFGDGTTSSGYAPAYTYTKPGIYPVTLTATDAGSGCTSVASIVLVIKVFNTAFGSTASYVTSGSCPPLLVQFTSYANYYSTITWNFGDGDSVSNVTYPSHVYAKAGKYYVTLTVVGVNGETVVTEDSIFVLAPSAVLEAAAPAICVGQADTLAARGAAGVKSYNWDFGDGYVGTTGGGSGPGGGVGGSRSGDDSMAVHVYQTPGVYTAKLVVADSLGCSAVAASADVISVHAPPVVALTPPQAAVCLGSSVSLSAALSGGTYFSWSPASGLSQTNTATPQASPLVSTVYTVTVTDGIGCSNTGSIPVTVVRPDTLKVTPDSTSICPGVAVQFHASGAFSYAWYGYALNGRSDTSQVSSPVISTVYMVIGVDSLGCFPDTVLVPVTVLMAPTVNAGPDLQVVAETPITIQAVGSADVVAWQWAPPTDLSCADCPQPVCTPKRDERYIVTVTAADGCVASDTVVVKLICDEARVRIPDAFTPNGDGRNDRFTVIGAISIVNRLAIFDRWGTKVFEADHFFPAAVGVGWDGTVGGRPAPAGVYVYFAEMQCPSGGVFLRKGTVVLVR